jgi:hypothetical protein
MVPPVGTSILGIVTVKSARSCVSRFWLGGVGAHFRGLVVGAVEVKAVNYVTVFFEKVGAAFAHSSNPLVLVEAGGHFH